MSGKQHQSIYLLANRKISKCMRDRTQTNIQTNTKNKDGCKHQAIGNWQISGETEETIKRNAKTNMVANAIGRECSLVEGI